MEWVAQAEEFLGKFGWGARGKNLGVSRMFGTGDATSLARNAFVGTARPRGVLSGFLAIVPGTGAVYIPPIAAKVPPQRMRLRVSTAMLEKGAVFSAYLTRDSPRTCVIEDVLVWNGVDVWSTRSFSDRWNNLLGEFVDAHFRSDDVLQGFKVALAKYISPKSLQEPDEKSVIELVPEAAGQKRLIWMAPRPAATPLGTDEDVPAQNVTSAGEFSVVKEAGMGPDVYAVYKGSTRLGLALVRTLAISKALRLAITSEVSSVAVHAVHNKIFDKYEILEVVGPKIAS